MNDAAIEAAAAAVPAGEGPVEVLGESAFAEALRARLGAAVPDDARPAVVVETRGDAAAGAALARVADLGTVVLAGGDSGREPVALDLYGDLHVRGLTLVGVQASRGAETAS